MRVDIRVCELAEQLRGVSYDKGEASSISRPGYLPVLRAGNITENGLDFDDLVFVPDKRISAKQKIRRNDVIIAASSGSLDVVGKAARALEDFEGGFGAFCKVLRPGPDVDPSYFAHFFRTRQYRKIVSSLAAGVNINNLRNEHLDEIKVPIPSPDEQRRLAGILDKAVALRVKRRAFLTQLDMLTRSIFLDMFGDPATNPKGWPVRRMEEVTQIISGATPRTSNREFWDGDINWVTPKELSALSGLYIHVTERRITQSGLRSCAATILPKGAVLFSSRAPIGHTAICGVPMATNQGFKSFVPTKGQLDSYFLLNWLRLRRPYLEALGSGATFKEVSKAVVARIPIAIPPAEYQVIFARTSKSIERLRVSCQVSASALETLLASLQQRAFRGEL